MSDDTRDADEAHDLMSERETSMVRKEARTLGASAFERLEAAIGELRKWLDNDDCEAPIDDLHDIVGAFNEFTIAGDAAPALPPELTPDVLVCVHCEAPSGEIHSPMCAVRAGAERLYKVKGAGRPAPLTEGEAHALAARVQRACMDLSPAAQIQAWRSVILSASRGDIPPEVRPTGNPSKLSNGPPTLAAHQDLERRVALLERRRPRVGKWVRVNATTRDAFGEGGEHVARAYEAGERWFWWVRVAFAPMVIGEPADTEAEALAAADAVLATWADRVGVKPLPPVPRGGEGQPIGVIGKVRVRWCGLAASPLRTDAEETELHHLGAMLAAVGLETWAPVPRKELPPYPGDEGAS